MTSYPLHILQAECFLVRTINKHKLKIPTLYFAAKTFFTITKLTSIDALVCKTPPIEVTNFAISAYKTYNHKGAKKLTE